MELKQSGILWIIWIFAAFAGLVDSLMVSSLGAYAVAAVGLTTQPKFLGLAVFMAINVSVSALAARRAGQYMAAKTFRYILHNKTRLLMESRFVYDDSKAD